MHAIEPDVKAAPAASCSADPLGWLPLARLNLRYNPFGELTAAERVAAAVVDVGDLVSWLVEPGRSAASGPLRAAQFIGDCGRGKTTHLLALRACFTEAAYAYLPADQPTPVIPSGCPLVIDEAQRLSWRARREVFRRGVPLVLGTHVDLVRPLVRHGYVVRTMEVSEQLTADRLAEILNRRIESARLCSGPLPRVARHEAARLIGKFGNDVRAIESHLYTQFQAWKRAEDGKLRFVD